MILIGAHKFAGRMTRIQPLFSWLYLCFKMEGIKKPPCKFGDKCYRKNPKHFDVYSHPGGLSKQSKFGKVKKDVTPRENRKLTRSSSKKEKNDLRELFGVKNPKEKTNNKVKSQNDKNAFLEINNETLPSTSSDIIKNKPNETGSSCDLGMKNKNVEDIIKTLFLVDMPPDFYSFYDFYKSAKDSLHFDLSELKLVGPFDVLSGDINYSVDKDLLLCHWRYYYDPPEFQTVLCTDSGFHIGYWRDDPKENPAFLASNNPNEDYIFKVEAENIFGSVFHYLNEFNKTCDPFKKMKISKLQSSLGNWAKKNKFSLEKKTAKVNERQRKVVSKTFHSAGIVVPVETKTDLGYRPLIETEENLKKICKLIMAASDDSEKESLWDNLQPLITAANIANDECDFGNSLELGINLFCMGSPVFHETVEHLLSTAYSLLDRTEFEKIIKAHLKFRRKGSDMSTCS